MKKTVCCRVPQTVAADLADKARAQKQTVSEYIQDLIARDLAEAADPLKDIAQAVRDIHTAVSEYQPAVIAQIFYWAVRAKLR